MLTRLKTWWFSLRNKILEYPVLYSQIEHLLKTRIKPSKYYEIMDSWYYTTTLDNLKKITNFIPIKYQPYKKETFDCDDFTREYIALIKKMFPSLLIGRAHVYREDKSKHVCVMLFYVTKTNRLDYTFLEPQTNKIARFAWKPYMVLIE